MQIPAAAFRRNTAMADRSAGTQAGSGASAGAQAGAGVGTSATGTGTAGDGTHPSSGISPGAKGDGRSARHDEWGRVRPSVRRNGSNIEWSVHLQWGGSCRTLIRAEGSGLLRAGAAGAGVAGGGLPAPAAAVPWVERQPGEWCHWQCRNRGRLGGGAVTPEEQRAAINRRIDDSLVVFDRGIRTAQDAINKERGEAEAAGAAGGNGSGEGSGPFGAGSGAGGTGGAKGTSGSAGTGSGSGAAAPGASTAGQGSSNHGAGTPSSAGAGGGGGGPSHVPADVGDGNDDDIVARQLREAAMKEKDPKLQEKLWQEYRDYKKDAK